MKSVTTITAHEVQAEMLRLQAEYVGELDQTALTVAEFQQLWKMSRYKTDELITQMEGDGRLERVAKRVGSFTRKAYRLVKGKK